MAQFQKGEVNNPHKGRGNSKNKIPSKKALDNDLITNSGESAKRLAKLLSDDEEKVRFKAADKILTECLKIIKADAKYKDRHCRNKQGLRFQLLSNLQASLDEIINIAKNSKDVELFYKANAKIVDETLAILSKQPLPKLSSDDDVLTGSRNKSSTPVYKFT